MIAPGDRALSSLVYHPPGLALVAPEPVFRQVGRGGSAGRWREYAERVVVHDVARQRLFVVPAGFRFDGPSVPRLCECVIDDDDIGDVAAGPHDYLYGRGGVATAPSGLSVVYTRAEADALFRDLMAWRGVEPWKREAAYEAVHHFGAPHWAAAA